MINDFSSTFKSKSQCSEDSDLVGLIQRTITSSNHAYNHLEALSHSEEEIYSEKAQALNKLSEKGDGNKHYLTFNDRRLVAEIMCDGSMSSGP